MPVAAFRRHDQHRPGSPQGDLVDGIQQHIHGAEIIVEHRGARDLGGQAERFPDDLGDRTASKRAMPEHHEELLDAPGGSGSASETGGDSEGDGVLVTVAGGHGPAARSACERGKVRRCRGHDCRLMLLRHYLLPPSGLDRTAAAVRRPYFKRIP